MTIYVDDFHTIAASLNDGVRWCNMIGTNDPELHRFARIVGQGCNLSHAMGRYELTPAARMRAVLLGAEPVTYQQLTAMNALRLMGEAMGRPETARARRSKIALQILEQERAI